MSDDSKKKEENGERADVGPAERFAESRGDRGRTEADGGSKDGNGDPRRTTIETGLVASGAPSDLARCPGEQGRIDDETQFDGDAFDIVASVLYRDTEDAREFVARGHIAAARTDVDNLKKEQSTIGAREQIEAIKRTGACPDARFWWIVSWVLVILDVFFWYIAGAQMLEF